MHIGQRTQCNDDFFKCGSGHLEEKKYLETLDTG